MVSEARKQSMASMETDYSEDTYFRWKIKWRLEHLGVLRIMGEKVLVLSSMKVHHQSGSIPYPSLGCDQKLVGLTKKGAHVKLTAFSSLRSISLKLVVKLITWITSLPAWPKWRYIELRQTQSKSITWKTWVWFLSLQKRTHTSNLYNLRMKFPFSKSTQRFSSLKYLEYSHSTLLVDQQTNKQQQQQQF